MANAFSVDVEDWFHILDTPTAPKIDEWTGLPSRVVPNTRRLLRMLQKERITATFFILGWVAEHFPELVREIASEGHELASHGYAHGLVYEQTPEAFRADLQRASGAIESACGKRPRGYRAPGFSITGESLWALDVLAEEGFEYDSSIFPAPRDHGGLAGAQPRPSTLTNGLREIPVSTVRMGPTRLAYLGGGYLRFLPGPMISGFAWRQEHTGRPLVLYVHPRDLDPDQPRIPLSRRRSFKCYMGLERCEGKIARLLEAFRWGPMEALL